MPKFNNDLFVRNQVLEAYRTLDDPEQEQVKPIEGSVLRKTRAILFNRNLRIKEEARQEFQDLYKIGQLWHEEVEHIWDRRERNTVLRGLAQFIPRREATAAERIFQLFQYKPEALRRLIGVTKTNIQDMKIGAFEELQQEVQIYQRDFNVVERFLDI